MNGARAFVCQKVLKRSNMVAAGYRGRRSPRCRPGETVAPNHSRPAESDELGHPQVRQGELELRDLEELDARFADGALAHLGGGLPACVERGA